MKTVQIGTIKPIGRRKFMIIRVNKNDLKVREIFTKRSGKNTISMTFGDFYTIEK